MNSEDAAEDALLTSIEELFLRIRNSERFAMLRSIQLSGVVSEIREVPEAANLTIGELVESGAGDFLSKCAGNEKVVAATRKLLDDFFSPDENAAPFFQSAAPRRIKQGSAPRLAATKGISGIESIEATQRLVELCAAFRKLPNLAAVEDQTIHEFWDEKWPRAPFEETLKFKQILSLDIDSFVRKRSMSSQRTASFIAALEKAYNHFSGGKTDLSAQQKFPASAAVQPGETRWNRDSVAKLPLYCVSFLSAFETECAKVQNSQSPFAAVLRSLPRVLTAKELLSAWFQHDLTQPTIAELIGVSAKDLSSTQRAAAKKLLTLLEKEFSQLHLNLRSTLRGAGQSLEQICRIFGDPGLDAVFQNGLVSLVLRCIGAKVLQADGHEFNGQWTLDSRFVSGIFETLRGALPMQDLKLRAQLKALLPDLPQKELIAAFKKKASMHPDKRIWSAKQRP